MNAFQLFNQEVKKFSKTNWWVYIIYLILLAITIVISTDDIVLVIGITTFHFIADIFMMMMFYSYSVNDYKNGTYFQIFSATNISIA